MEFCITNLLRKCRNTLCISSFRSEFVGEKDRQSPQTQLCGVALGFLRFYGPLCGTYALRGRIFEFYVFTNRVLHNMPSGGDCF